MDGEVEQGTGLVWFYHDFNMELPQTVRLSFNQNVRCMTNIVLLLYNMVFFGCALARPKT